MEHEVRQVTPRDDKADYKRRKLAKKAQLRDSHRTLTRLGIPGRVDGNKLGHRRRIELLQSEMAAL